MYCLGSTGRKPFRNWLFCSLHPQRTKRNAQKQHQDLCQSSNLLSNIFHIFTLRKTTFLPAKTCFLKQKPNRPFTKYHVARHPTPHHSRRLRAPSIAMSPPLRSLLPLAFRSSLRSATNRSQPLWRKALVSQSAAVSLREYCYSLSPGCWEKFGKNFLAKIGAHKK